MDISWPVDRKESCLKLRHGYMIKFSSQGKLYKVAVWMYDGVFISRKVV